MMVAKLVYKPQVPRETQRLLEKKGRKEKRKKTARKGKKEADSNDPQGRTRSKQNHDKNGVEL